MISFHSVKRGEKGREDTKKEREKDGVGTREGDRGGGEKNRV